MGMFSIDEQAGWYSESEIKKNIDKFIPRGHWCVDDDGWVICSCCNEELPYVLVERATFDRPYSRKDYIDETPYCPHCGAKMESN